MVAAITTIIHHLVLRYGQASIVLPMTSPIIIIIIIINVIILTTIVSTNVWPVQTSVQWEMRPKSHRPSDSRRLNIVNHQSQIFNKPFDDMPAHLSRYVLPVSWPFLSFFVFLFAPIRALIELTWDIAQHCWSPAFVERERQHNNNKKIRQPPLRSIASWHCKVLVKPFKFTDSVPQIFRIIIIIVVVSCFILSIVAWLSFASFFHKRNQAWRPI